MLPARFNVEFAPPRLRAGFAAIGIDRSVVALALAMVVLVAGVPGCSRDAPDGARQPVSDEQPFDSSALRSALERIVDWHTRHQTGTVGALRPGLKEAELARQLEPLPCRLPREIQALYVWHDGMETGDEVMVWYHYFPSLDNALRNYRKLTAIGLLHADEFPVLEFEGEYYVVRCTQRAADTSPVWLVFHNPERPLNYVSFTTYMATAAEWYESGAAQAGDLRQMRAIHQRLNPGAEFPYAVD